VGANSVLASRVCGAAFQQNEYLSTYNNDKSQLAIKYVVVSIS